MKIYKVTETYREKYSGDVVQIISYYNSTPKKFLQEDLGCCKSRRKKNGTRYFYSIKEVRVLKPLKVLVIDYRTKI